MNDRSCKNVQRLILKARLGGSEVSSQMEPSNKYEQTFLIPFLPDFFNIELHGGYASIVINFRRICGSDTTSLNK